MRAGPNADRQMDHWGHSERQQSCSSILWRGAGVNCREYVSTSLTSAQDFSILWSRVAPRYKWIPIVPGNVLIYIAGDFLVSGSGVRLIGCETAGLDLISMIAPTSHAPLDSVFQHRRRLKKWQLYRMVLLWAVPLFVCVRNTDRRQQVRSESMYAAWKWLCCKKTKGGHKVPSADSKTAFNKQTVFNSRSRLDFSGCK